MTLTHRHHLSRLEAIGVDVRFGQSTLEAALSRRDEAIRVAYGDGVPRADINTALGIHRRNGAVISRALQRGQSDA